MRLIDSCITQLKAQGPSRTCNESATGSVGTTRAEDAQGTPNQSQTSPNILVYVPVYEYTKINSAGRCHPGGSVELREPRLLKVAPSVKSKQRGELVFEAH